MTAVTVTRPVLLLLITVTVTLIIFLTGKVGDSCNSDEACSTVIDNSNCYFNNFFNREGR